MWQNILIILIIILFSYVFTLKDKKYFDLQMLFILLCMFIIVIYKLMFFKYFKIKENFESKSDIDKFSEGISNSDSSTTDNSLGNSVIISKLQNDIDTLKDEIDRLTKSKPASDDGLKDGSLDVNKSITEQDFEIKKLEKNLENLKQQLFFTTEEKAKKTYKKIKVYNSCEPKPESTTTIEAGVVSSPEIVNANKQKEDFFKMLLDKLNETGFKLNLNLV